MASRKNEPSWVPFKASTISGALTNTSAPLKAMNATGHRVTVRASARIGRRPMAARIIHGGMEETSSGAATSEYSMRRTIATVAE